MQTDIDGDLRRPYEIETSRLKLLNKTLQSENDFLREELQLTLHRCREQHRDGYKGATYSPPARYGQDYNSVDDFEVKFKRLEEENRKLREDSNRKTPTKLKPLVTDDNNEEVDQLKDEVKHLRNTIDKLSRSFTSPSKSKSPSPNKPRPQESSTPQKQNLHKAYYDRSTEESTIAIERQQAMYDRIMR